MAKYSNTVEYNIRTTLDNSGIAKLQSELVQLQNRVNTLGAKGLIPESSMNKTLADIKTVQTALQQAFNPKLGMLNASKFMSSLKAQGASLNSIYQSFNNAGAAGQRAFTSMYGQIAKIDTGMRSVSKTTDKIFNTMGNTFRWGLIASGFAAIMNSAHQAAEYVSDLDKSLTEIQMVSAASRDNMNELARAANEAAKELGGTTVQMTEATKVFIQQGLSQEEALKMGEYAVHLANVSEQDSTITSDELTAMKNAFQIPIEDLGNAVSKWAVIANNAAVSMEELSVASQKAASVAQTTGVDMEQFAGHIAAIEATTREAPENIGNGLKTLYSRFADIKLGETLEDGVNLGQFSSALKKVGVDVLDASGEMKDVGSILEETMAVWKTLDKTQQNALATTVAGRFQLARFEALMNSQDIYKQAVSVARAETGTETYDRMQETYRESLQGRTQALIASVEELFLDIFNSNSFNGAVDALQGLVDVLDELIKATGGGETALLGLSTVLINLASTSLSRGISNIIINRQADLAGQRNLETQQQLARAQLQGQGLNTGNAEIDKFANDIAKVNQYGTSLNEEQQQTLNNLIKDRVQILNDLSSATERQTNAEQVLRIAMQEMGDTGKMTKDELIALAEQFQMMSEEELLQSDGFKKFRSEITLTTQSFNEFIDILKKGETNTLVIGESAEKLSRDLKKLSNSGVLTEEQVTKLNVTLKQLKGVIQGDEEAIRKLSSAELTKMAQALSLSDEQLVKLIQHFNQARGEVAAMSAANEVAAGSFEHMAHGVELQNTANQIIGLVSGIGQLAFAWQSFKQIGSIWENNDLDLGEKVLETIINISFAIPMLITGVRDAIQGFKTLSKAIQEFTLVDKLMTAAEFLTAKALDAKTKNTEKATAAQVKETVTNATGAATSGIAAEADMVEAGTKITLAEATHTAATALWEFAVANAAAAAPFAIIAAALAFTAISIGSTIQQYEDYKQKVKEDLDSSNELISSINQQKDTYDSLYNIYQKTGQITDELKDSSLQMAEALQIEGAEAKIARGEFAELNEQIQEATNSQLAYNSAKARQQQGILAKEINPQVGLPDLTTVGDAGYVIDSRITTTEDVIQNALNKQSKWNEYQEQINQWQKRSQELSPYGGFTYDSKYVESQIKGLQQLQDQYQLTEEESQLLELAKQRAENLFAQDLNNNYFDNFTSIEEIKNSLDRQTEIFDEYNNILATKGKEEADAWYDGLISQIGEKTADDTLKELIKNYFEKTTHNIDVNDLSDTALAGKKTGNFKQDVTDLIHNTQKTQDDISEDTIKSMGIEEEDLTNVFNAYSDSIEKSSEALSRHKQIVDESVKSAEDRLQAVLDERNAELEKTKTIENATERTKEITNINSKYAKDIQKLNRELNNAKDNSKEYDKTLDSITATQINVEQGVKTLAANFDKWAEVLNDDNALLSDTVATSAEVAKALSMMTGIDASSFDTSFIQDNLGLIEEAAGGSVDALRALQLACTEKYLVDIGFTEDSKTLPDDVSALMSQIQAIASNADVGVDVTADVEPLIQEFIRMAQQAGMSVQDIQNAIESLNGIGITANISTRIEEIVADLPRISSSEGLLKGAISTITQVAGAVKFPEITYTTNGAGDAGLLSNAAGAGGSGGKGGGGGGGGGGKSYEPKTKDPIEEEIDRYEKVQTALDEVDSQINKLTVDQDRLMGNNWIENLEKETGLLQEQIPLYEEKLRIQKEEQQELQKQLADNYGARFNDIGLLQNYAEIHKRLEKDVNDLINRYNATGDEEGQNALEKQIESAQEKLEKFKKQYQRYDTLVSKDMIDTQKALEEIQNRLEDIRYEAYKARKEAAEQLKDLRDDRREFNESIATLFNDDTSLSLGNAMSRFKDLFKADEKYVADAITMYKKKLSQATSEDMKKFYQAQIDSLKKAQSNGTSVLDLNFQRLNEVMAEYDKWLAGGQTSWSEADLWEAMQDAFDDAVDLAKELKDQVDDIHDKIADVIDEMDEATERRKDAFESINDELEYMRDMSELLYGDQAYATQAQTYNLQAHNNEQLLKTLEAAQKANQKILEATKDNAATQEEYQAALEKERELQGEILDTRKEIAEAYKDAKEAANNLAVQNWLDQFQGEIDGVKVPLKYAQEAWERINENADLYLDELNRAWETEKLQNKYLELINNNTDPTIQKQITDQMNQQLEYLRDKTNLSKYDVEYANAQLEILQKTIALEDARANKNQMRLRRDTQGNYSYVYAASQADIASAENDLLDAQMNGYNISVEANRNSADSFYQKIQAMADQLRDAANDATLSEEQIAAITADIIKDGYEYLDAMGEQLTTAQKNMIESFIQAAQNLGAENSQAVQIIADELINNVDATVETISDKFVSGVERMIGPDGLALFREEAEQTRDDIVQNVHDFENAISDANVNIETPLTDIDTNLQHTTTSMSELADEAQRFYDIMNNNTGVILQAAGELAEYQAKLTDAENELSVYSEKVNKLGQDLETQKTINTQLNATNSDLQRQLEQAKKDAEAARNGGGSGSGSGSGGSLARNRVGEIFYLIHYGQVGNEGDRTPNLRNRGYSDREIRAGQKAINLAYLNDYDNEDAISWAAAHMKTGGYTGTWSGANTDSNGKLAVLHQKELVLNAADTENILSAVDIIRNIVAALKGNISGGLLTNMISSIGQTGGDTIEQRVEIKAEFPNATSAREIEEAFDTIANTSYQYAYNKNKKVI